MTLLGVPVEQVEGMRQRPMWLTFEAVAPTLAYDAAILGKERSAPIERAADVAIPTLVMNGEASSRFMRHITRRWRGPSRRRGTSN